TLSLTLGSSVTVGTGPGRYPGFQIGLVDAIQGYHKHFSSVLNAGSSPLPADGIYLLELHMSLLQSDGVTPYPGINFSLPFFELYWNDANSVLPPGSFQTAQNWVQTNLVPFGDFNRDHLSTVDDIPAMLK